MTVSILICTATSKIIINFVAAVIGFLNQSYTTTEGEEFYFNIGLMSSTHLGREVVVVLSTQSDSAEGRMMVCKTGLGIYTCCT